MGRSLNARSAFSVVVLYTVLSILASLGAAIIFGGIASSATDYVVDSYIDSGIYGTIIVAIILLVISLYIFAQSRRDVFFERKPFALSKLYYLFPLAWICVTIVALFNVDYTAYSAGVIALVIVAAFAIGVNEELVTRGILLIGLRNSRFAEWKAWLITVLVFGLLHLVNVLGAANLTVVLVTMAGGTLLYICRRVFNNLFVPIGLHALYDVAFILLTGKYLIGQPLPDGVLDIQFASFLVLLTASIAFVIFGRGLLRNDTTGWGDLEQD